MNWLWVLAAINVVLLCQILFLREKLAKADHKLDVVLDRFEGLRLYLYEIDPQFDDERASDARVWAEDAHPLDMAEDAALLTRKKNEGRRMLNSPFESLDGPP
jgi:hypothetical protein